MPEQKRISINIVIPSSPKKPAQFLFVISTEKPGLIKVKAEERR